jgi:uncharacterized membrane protein
VTVWRAASGVAAAVLFVGSWTLIHHGFFHDHELVDTPLYEQYGDAMRAGMVPYRDFQLEYPPGALPAFLAPEITAAPGDFGHYGRAFTRWMLRCGIVLAVLCAAVLATLRAPPVRTAISLELVGLSPVLLGVLFLSRFDLWPAVLTAGALLALLNGRDRLGAGVLGAAVSAKLYPAVLVPVGLVWVWRRHGRGEALRWAGVLVAVLAAIFLPFAALSPGGLGHSFSVQLGRPLQIESLGSAVLLAAHHLFRIAATVHTDHGSQNLHMVGAGAVAAISTVLQLLALAAVWVLFANGPPRRERLVTACAAAVAAFVAFGKVFSPQFLIWLLPFAPLVRSRAAQALFAFSLLVTQLWFPDRYWLLGGNLHLYETTLVLVRDLAVVALFLVLMRDLAATREAITEPERASRATARAATAPRS